MILAWQESLRNAMASFEYLMSRDYAGRDLPEPPRPTAPCIPDEPDVDIELICLPDEDNPATRLRLGDDAEYSSDSE